MQTSNGVKIQDLTIAQAHQGLVNKEFSSVELCKAYLEKIREKDKDIFAFLSVIEETALKQAEEVDDIIKRGENIPVLAGIPCAVKDNIMVEGLKCTAASKILENYVALYEATVVRKLKKEKAVILGKTNLDEFAMGASGENSAFGPTKNPCDLTRVTGGSSSGSAAAVAADMAVYALGSDTAGSIRYPASLCGVVGLRPTYGAVSRFGLIAMASSLDQIGPLTKNIDDCKIVFDVIRGKDQMDSTSVDMRVENNGLKIKGLKIGVPKEYFVKEVDKEVEKIVKEAIKKYEAMGAKIMEVSLPHTDYAIATYYIIMPCEISANLARYDGIKYGHQDKSSNDLMEVYLRSRGRGLGDEVRRRIILGTYALSSGYYDAYYLKAQKVRTLVRQDFEKAFKKVDVLMTPVAPTPAFKLGEKIKDPLQMYLCDVFTGPVSLAGLPAVSLPVGKIDNLPVGLQIIGKPFEEDKILEISKLYAL
ncbi:MAG: Asp-tRNA(Asn)/Glu-tRNA(Gln) amidotransferase subunit GatA [Candidatus Pacebacteria bacterium]|nr:Asp-tRNA(Asn)/Glu-tRNA(Gln) amidotransferase subunit GatA [Candidatus Paceibacterota bacterium]